VQPDRPCYIRRAADEQLLAAIGAQRFVCVLAPRAMGKSSLLGRTIRRLRADGQMAAAVDLTQIGSRSEGADSARWHYSIAYRICRELRLKVDLQAWWHDKNLLLSEQRLVEFFWDIVLGHTTEPVTIFFDEAERAVDRPFAGELFAALNSCYTRRVSEPGFTRLNFVVLGATTPDQLCPDRGISPFVAGSAIRLDDFTLEECAALAPGLGDQAEVAKAVLARIHTWTHGQPYLTQKLARGVARRGGQLADVDAALHELFLAPGISREEPLLGHIRAVLAGSSPRQRQAVAVLGRLARGGEVIDDPASPAQQLLQMAGLVSSDDNGMLRYRNRIVEQVFDDDWVRAVQPTRWQRPVAIGAAVLAGLVIVPLWYTQVLPRSAIETLTRVGSDTGSLERAHARLKRLPGFGSLADRLLVEAMLRRGGEAKSIDELEDSDAILRQLPDGAALADELMANFWLRQAELAAGQGQRDSALVQALAAADDGSAAAVAMAANLVDGDYRELEHSIRLEGRPLAVAVDWPSDELVVVDEGHRVQRWSLEAGGGAGSLPAGGVQTLPTRLTALQQVGVTRGFFVDEPGRAGALKLRLTVEHGRTSDLLVRLAAPSGAAVEISLPERSGGVEQFAFTASDENGLTRLADESITGQWELTVFDRLSGESGRLLDWGLSFGGVPTFWNDAPVDGLPLPDPQRVEQIAVAIADNGRLGVAVPARFDARGAASVFDLVTGERLADLPLTDRADTIEFVAPNRLLLAGARRATLWDIGATTEIGEFVGANGLAGRPVVSPDGRYYAVAEPIGPGARISLIRIEDGRVVSQFLTDDWQDWALGPDAAYLVGVDGSRRGRVLDPMTGKPLAEFFHDRELERVVETGAADRIAAVDRMGDIVSWGLNPGSDTLRPRDSRYLGTTLDAASIDVADSDGGLAYLDADGLLTVRGAEDGWRRATLDHGTDRDLRTFLSPDARRLVSVAGSVIRYWRIDDEPPPGPDFGVVSAVALDPHGRFAVLGYRSGEVRLLRDLPGSIERGDATEPVMGHRGVVTSLVVNTDGELAASGSSDGVIRVWDTQTGRRRPYVLRHPAGPIGALAFSPDDRWLVAAGATSARVFELDSGELASEVEVDGTPLSVAFSADSRLLAVGDSAGNIFLATPGGTAGLLTLRLRAPITALAFAPEPGMLASGSSDGDLVLWDTLTASAIEGAHRFAAPIRWIDLSPGATEIHLKSGAWLYTLDRSADTPRVTASRLLPDRLRNAPSLAFTGPATIRGLAIAGGGHLELEDIGLGADAGGLATELPHRDWHWVLGLELDRATGRVRP
jgi:subtilisin-like proprotein convertase family protein